MMCECVENIVKFICANLTNNQTKHSTYGQSLSKSDFCDRNERPENSATSDNGFVHEFSSVWSQTSIVT